MKRNFLEETIAMLHGCGKTEQDIVWIGNNFKRISWSSFKKIADFDYEPSGQSPYIDSSFFIQGEDWWLERDLEIKDIKSVERLKVEVWKFVDVVDKEFSLHDIIAPPSFERTEYPVFGEDPRWKDENKIFKIDPAFKL